MQSRVGGWASWVKLLARAPLLVAVVLASGVDKKLSWRSRLEVQTLVSGRRYLEFYWRVMEIGRVSIRRELRLE